jgi:monofunctional biosynthetic peptidoglycan transglycosylase
MPPRKKRKKPPLARARRMVVIGVAVWFGVTFASVLVLRWVDPLTSSVMLADRLLAWLDGEPGYRFAYRFTPWPQISSNMKLAVIASEDQRFADHFGFDFVEIGHVLARSDVAGASRGASTLTQQTAKNMFLWSGRSWVRKGLEAYFALLIEICWPKTRILEIYLNIAEFGRGVYGVGAASERYFKQPPARLNRPQSALLAAVLPNPTQFLVVAPSRYVRARQAWIEAQMRALGGERYLWKLE